MTLRVTWAPGAPDDNQSDEQALAQARDVAGAADVAVIFLSARRSVKMARMAIAGDLNILPAHEQLIREVAGLQPNVVVVLANSDAVVMPWLWRMPGAAGNLLCRTGDGARRG